MVKKRVVILGAGISGLALGWYLKKYGRNEIEITILEKSPRPGGWIQSQFKDGFLFESGPRSCRPKGIGIHTLELIEELGLQGEVILPDRAAKKRYIHLNQSLQALPGGLFSLAKSPFLGMILKGCWKDFKTPPKLHPKDESIESFFSRRMGTGIAQYFADPLTLGIYAGDSSRLSMQSCFPILQKYENDHGGILRSLYKRKKADPGEKSDFVRSLQKNSLYSFQEGMESLPRALYTQLSSHIHLAARVKKIKRANNAMEVELESGKILQADHVFSTLSASQLSGIIQENEINALLKKIPFASPVVLNLGYHRCVLKKKGYGYLIPSHQKESVLGVVWNSCIFPQQNRSPENTSLTVMMGGIHHPGIIHLEDREIIESALKTLNAHLSIKVDPDLISIAKARCAIPQYLIGHSLLVQEIQEKCKEVFPGMDLLGTSFFGVSVNECIAQAMRTAQKICVT